MKKFDNVCLLIWVTTMFCPLISIAQNNPIVFENATFDQVLKKGKAEDRLIFMDAFATWCGPCKGMALNVFSDSTVGSLYNAKFVNARFDMEEGEGKTLAELYDVTAYPTLFFMDGSGTLVYKHVGALGVEQFYELGKDIYSKYPVLKALKAKYSTGYKNLPFLRELIDLQEFFDQDASEATLLYLKMCKPAELLTPYASHLIINYIGDIDSKEFNLFYSNRHQYELFDGIKSVNDKIIAVMIDYLNKGTDAEGFSMNQYPKLLSKIKPLKYEQENLAILYSKVHLFLKMTDYDSLAKTILSLAEKREINASKMRDFANVIASNSSKTDVLQNAAKIARKSLLLSDVASGNDTYAGILFKLGQKDAAIAFQNRAVSLAEVEQDENYQEYVDRRKKME